MISHALYHCGCEDSRQDGELQATCAPAASTSFRPLAGFYFCEECDAIRCPDCVTSEVNIYFCPLCQFEVPSASVRAEQHTCARNCFLCPVCDHTCSAAATEPADASSSNGEPPYWLWCQACRWDSRQVGISFDRPTGLAQQLAKAEPADAAAAEFDRLRDHLEPHLKAGLALQPAAATPSTAIKGLSSLSSRYGSLMNLAGISRTRQHTHLPSSSRDELQLYQSQVRSTSKTAGEQRNVDFLANLDSASSVTPLGKRGQRAWTQPLDVTSLRPTRVPLQAKRTKRCPTCKHILVKPESKSNSIKYRIKLVASSYLPAIQVFRRPPTSTGSRISAAGAAASRRGATKNPIQPPSSSILAPPELDEPMRPGRSYAFELAFINPLYEPITVEAVALRASQPLESLEQPAPDLGPLGASSTEYSLQLPTGRFPISAFAEQWEYEDAEPEDLEGYEPRRQSSSGRRRQATGILEKKANRTTVMLEVGIGKEYVGPVHAYLLVTYVYTADEERSSSPTKESKVSESDAQKSFSFWTLVKLGHAQPLPAARKVSSITPAST